MRKHVLVLVALAAVVAVAPSCRPNVTMWEPCSSTDGVTGSDGTYVLVCRGGRWEPVMTATEFVSLGHGERPALSPLPRGPVGPPTTTTSTTSTTTTTTPGPEALATVVYSPPRGGCADEVVTTDGTQVGICQAGFDPVAIVHVRHQTERTEDCDFPYRQREVLSVEGTITQGSSVLGFTDDRLYTDQHWNTFDVDDGPITVRVTAIELGPEEPCPFG